MTYEKEREYAIAIDQFMREHEIYPDLWTTHANLDEGLIVNAQIDWGDWKHDHLYYDHLMEEYARKNGLTITCSDTFLTEENGSDCYSACHIHKMLKMPRRQ